MMSYEINYESMYIYSKELISEINHMNDEWLKMDVYIEESMIIISIMKIVITNKWFYGKN